MCFRQFVDEVGQLTATPVFYAVDFAAACFDNAFVALEHGGDLFALIRVDHENNLIVTHNFSLRMKNSPHLRQIKVWGKGKPSIIKEKPPIQAVLLQY
jgi:hypothetical protein